MNYFNQNKVTKVTFFIIFFVFFFIIFFFIIIKTSKNLSAKYYQENKDRLQKRPSERYQNLSLEGKKKSKNLVVNT